MLSIDIKLSVINKYFVDGKGYKRIAKELNISRDTVRSIICRYRKQKGIPIGMRDGIINNPLECQLNSLQNQKEYYERKLMNMIPLS